MQYCRIISLDNNYSVKFTSSRGDNSTTYDNMVMKIAHAQFHMYTNIMQISEQCVQNCRRKALDNNNSVKFTSSRGDNSTTNDSMVMKIAHAQLHECRTFWPGRFGQDVLATDVLATYSEKMDVLAKIILYVLFM